MPQIALESHVSGTVWKIERQIGDALAAGDTVMVIEAMKMEIPVEAPCAGTLSKLLVAEGDAVSEGQLLGQLGPTGS